MTDAERKKLKGYYLSLSGLERQLVESAAKNNIAVDWGVTSIFMDEIYQIDKAFPNLLPSSKPAPTQIPNYSTDRIWYRIDSLQAFLAVALAKIKNEIEEPSGVPVIETRGFSFVSNVKLRDLIERDYAEIQRAFISECWKSTIILSGGAIEALLLDLLQKNAANALSATKAPKGKSNLETWVLSELINVAVELQLVPVGVEKLSHSLREYRNLVHPGKEIRDKLIFDREEAKIAIEVLHILHRELS